MKGAYRMLGILRTLLPLLVGTALLIIWVVLILIVVVRWVIGQFQAEKAALAVVTLLAFLLLPVAAGLLGHSFFRSAPRIPTGESSALSELIDRWVEGSPKDAAEEDAPSSAPEE